MKTIILNGNEKTNTRLRWNDDQLSGFNLKPRWIKCSHQSILNALRTKFAYKPNGYAHLLNDLYATYGRIFFPNSTYGKNIVSRLKN